MKIGGKVILVMLIVFYAAIMIYFSLIRHWTLGTYYFDLGIMHQTVYNSAYGHLLEMTDTDSTQQIHRFNKHFDPLMLIFVPFYWIYPQAEVLLIGQSIILTLGGIPIYLLTKEIMKKKKTSVIFLELSALFFLFLYLNYYPMQKINMADFHAVSLVTPLLILTFYLIEIGKYKWSFLCIFLSILGKENVSLITMMLGLYLFFIKKQRLFGIFVAFFSLIVFLVVVGIIIPSQRENFHLAASYYSLDIKTNLNRFFSLDTFRYIYQLFQPTGFIGLLSPLPLLIALPEWFINILSKNTSQRDLQYHYAALIIPFIFISSIYSFRTIFILIKKKFKNFSTKAILFFLCFYVFIFTLYTQIRYGPFFNSHFTWAPDKLLAVKMWSERLKDDNIPLSASGHIAPHVSGRRYFYNFLFDFSYHKFNMTKEDIKKNINRYEKADYVILEKSEMNNPNELIRFYYQHLKTNKKFYLIYDENGIEVYKKRKDKKI